MKSLMPFLLRVINNKNRWRLDDPDCSLSWLSPGDIPADTLRELYTDGNKLSVFEVGENDKELIERVVVGFAATRPGVDKIEWVIFKREILNDLRCEVMQESGATPDEAANKLHLDVVKLSGTKLVDLAKAIFYNLSAAERWTRDEVRRKLLKAAAEKHININDLNKAIREKLARPS